MKYLKTTIKALLILIVSISCSSDDDSNTEVSSSINPPDWILGSWSLDNVVSNSGFSFKEDDFCSIFSNAETCFREQVNNAGSVNLKSDIIEDATADNYSITIVLGSLTSVYQFKRISDTKIEWLNDGLGDLVETFYIKQN